MHVTLIIFHQIFQAESGKHELASVAVKPKYRLVHPENDLFQLSRKIFTGSKYPTKKTGNTSLELAHGQTALGPWVET